MAHATTTPTGIRRLVDNANEIRMQMNANVGGIRPKARIVKPAPPYNSTAPVHRKPPGQPIEFISGVPGLKRKPCAAAGIFPKKPALTLRTGDQNVSHIGTFPHQLTKSATFILDDRPRSSSLSAAVAAPVPVLPRVVNRNVNDKKRRSASVGASEKKLPAATNHKSRAISRIPIPIDRDEQARRRAAIELQARKREIERVTDEALKEVQVKMYELKLQERLLIEDRDRQLMSIRKDIEEGKNIVRPVRLLFDDNNEQATSLNKQSQHRPRPPVARRRSRSLNYPQFEVTSPEEPSLPLFDENQDSPTFHNNQIMLLPKSAAKNPEFIYRSYKESWSRASNSAAIQTPPRLDFQARNAPPINSVSKRLHEQILSLYQP